jgi:4-hydroxybutyrate dehydrogenase
VKAQRNKVIANERLADASAIDGLAALDRVILINYITRVQFGFGAINSLSGEVSRLAFKRPLVVTDRGVLGAGIADLLERHLPSFVVFSDTPSNPTEAAARAAGELYRRERCDGLIAVGGGSPMDLAKAAALVVTHDGPLVSYALVNGGFDRITSNVPGVVAIPTTAGTGSEVARATVIIMADGSKRAIGSPHLIPKVAICDPELTVGLPPLLTAATGFDALAHCIETYCSPVINPPAEAIALNGMVRAVTFMERAVADSSDREARWHMLMAALQGGLAFQKGLGAVHALSHPLGELGVHHGTVNAILLPHVLEFNAPRIGPQLTAMANALGLKWSADVIAHVAGLIRRVGLPDRLGSLGVTEAHVQPMSQKAERDSCNATNPPPLRAKDYEVIMRRALH